MAKPLEPGQFVLRVNQDAKDNPEKRWPTLKGKACLPDGTEHWCSAYVNTNEDGTKWISGRIEKPCGERPRATSADDDESIPF